MRRTVRGPPDAPQSDGQPFPQQRGAVPQGPAAEEHQALQSAAEKGRGRGNAREGHRSGPHGQHEQEGRGQLFQ